jgi:Lar family restriction alleviation protein
MGHYDTVPGADDKTAPCPFCGGLNSSVVPDPAPTWVPGEVLWIVLCHACNAQGPHGLSGEDAVRKWNRRAPAEVAVP